MKTKAQGAMEYLMTYGWAILVVMIVGLAMWRLGVFDIRQGGAPTASGFGQIQPLLPSCVISENHPFRPAEWDVFQCNFVNAAGAEMRIKDINVTVNGEHCYESLANYYTIWTATSDYAYVFVDWFDGSIRGPRCHEGLGGVIIADRNDWVHCDGEILGELIIPKDHIFSIAAAGIESGPQSAYSGPCRDIEAGEVYKVDINMVYDIRVGGQLVEKSTSGTIRLSGE